MYRFFLILILALSGCATSFFDRDSRDPVYHQGGGTVIAPVLPTTGTIVGKEFQPGNQRLSEQRTMTPEELAITGVVATGVTLAMNKDYYRSSYLSGHCICMAENEPSFMIPCGTVTIVLETRDGEEVSRITSDDGEFVFPVERNLDYQIRAFSPYYSSSQKKVPLLQMGDQIVLHLTQKMARTGE